MPVANLALVACALGTGAVIACLFLPWYGGETASVSRMPHGGFTDYFHFQRRDAWDVIPGTAGFILAATLVTLTTLGVAILQRQRAATGAAAISSFLTVAVILWRVLDPASHMVTVRVPAGFLANGHLAPSRTLSVSRPTAGGDIAALIAAGIALAATAAWGLSRATGTDGALKRA